MPILIYTSVDLSLLIEIPKLMDFYRLRHTSLIDFCKYVALKQITISIKLDSPQTTCVVSTRTTRTPACSEISPPPHDYP